MISCLWLIVLFNAILGWYLIVFVLCFIKTIIRKNEKLIKNAFRNRILEEFGSDNPLAKEIEALDLGDEIGSMLDSRLNQITLKSPLKFQWVNFC